MKFFKFALLVAIMFSMGLSTTAQASVSDSVKKRWITLADSIKKRGVAAKNRAIVFHQRGGSLVIAGAVTAVALAYALWVKKNYSFYVSAPLIEQGELELENVTLALKYEALFNDLTTLLAEHTKLLADTANLQGDAIQKYREKLDGTFVGQKTEINNLKLQQVALVGNVNTAVGSLEKLSQGWFVSKEKLRIIIAELQRSVASFNGEKGDKHRGSTRSLPEGWNANGDSQSSSSNQNPPPTPPRKKFSTLRKGNSGSGY